MSLNSTHQFSDALLEWYDLNGRKDLPWKQPVDAYRIWISEIMLQQTQVQTVIPYFNRFIARFPDCTALAQAKTDEVLSLWSGLGYYSRARNLHQSSKIISAQHQGIFPDSMDALLALPGIGPSTAAAILSQAFNQPAAILDGNVKRVLARFFALPGFPEEAAVKKIFWEHARSCMPAERCADYTQAIMDLGATCCTNRNPACSLCPLHSDCLAAKTGEQTRFPTKKIKKPVPVRQQQFLVLVNSDGAVFLEKRPPSGLWGGLWCLPSLDEGYCALDYIKKQYALTGNKAEPLIAFKHKFSHFHLEINALRIETHVLANQLMEPKGQWYTQDQLSGLGLAKPTSLILAKVT